jgi:glutamate dehydrogenase/leucine dehydrogenase
MIDGQLTAILDEVLRGNPGEVELGSPDHLVRGANIAGFRRVATAMDAPGLI